ncbi:MAG: bifunctional UDP-N-acetylglucosamine diphosphorylase/glucosamine-1-phosphate N-acetyltransferase GlmU [Blastochloris viridis]|uniref:Bifunctional protein GlmU n=1 Tax=Blastochloris viridis TaxID=1079 RepID=A0A6N4R4B8_BLAVI|nr:MAG: bifunctional UDP-N-acetylglucosamine diphosphorylase/glucosamine-1-phosphate N-acetyltransferase GlmU [Blastochloris viridis]
MNTHDIAVIVLAAGKGTRMKSDLPKVLHPMAGMPMLGHVLHAARTLNPSKTVVITGYGAEKVEDYCQKHFPEAEFARQTEQLGTAHAIMQAESVLKDFTGTAVIVYADIMLSTRPDVLPTLMEQHSSNSNGLTLLTANVPNPTGLGRIFLKNNIIVNVEEKDCTPDQRKITTVNPAIHAIPSPLLFKLLKLVKNDNAQKEYYLPDIIALAHQNGAPVITAEVPSDRAELGMNSRAEVAEMETVWQTRKRAEAMAAGVTLVDPKTVYFSADTEIAPDVTIHQNVVFGAGVKIETGATILPFCHIEGAHLQRGANVGPFARIRPTSVVGENAKVGNFVELKNATMGAKASAGHLTYLGDATVGEHTNIGAGTITANYNHKTHAKAKTVIGNNASVGSNSVLVAPVTLGDGAYTGAGTVVRKNVEEGSLVFTTPDLITKTGYSK